MAQQKKRTSRRSSGAHEAAKKARAAAQAAREEENREALQEADASDYLAGAHGYRRPSKALRAYRRAQDPAVQARAAVAQVERAKALRAASVGDPEHVRTLRGIARALKAEAAA